MEENIILSGETKYDLATIKKFTRFNMYSSLRNKVVTVLAVALILVAIFGKFEFTFSMLVGLIGCVWLIELAFLPNMYSKKLHNSSQVGKTSTVKFEFFKDKLTAYTIREEKEVGKSELNYKDLYKVRITKEYIYLYISSNQAFICSRENLTGNYDEFVTNITNVLGKKVKIKK